MPKGAIQCEHNAQLVLPSTFIRLMIQPSQPRYQHFPCCTLAAQLLPIFEFTSSISRYHTFRFSDTYTLLLDFAHVLGSVRAGSTAPNIDTRLFPCTPSFIPAYMKQRDFAPNATTPSLNTRPFHSPFLFHVLLYQHHLEFVFFRGGTGFLNRHGKDIIGCRL